MRRGLVRGLVAAGVVGAVALAGAGMATAAPQPTLCDAPARALGNVDPFNLFIVKALGNQACSALDAGNPGVDGTGG